MKSLIRSVVNYSFVRDWIFPPAEIEVLRFPKISAAYPVLHDTAVRDPAQIVNLVRGIRAPVKPVHFRSTAKWITALWRGSVTDRSILVDRGADHGTCACADQRAHGCSFPMTGGGRTEGRARCCAPPGALP